MFDISTQTVSVWGREFDKYLSPTAKPGGRRKRQFTKGDLEMIALIADMKGQGHTFEDIHATLNTGQRGQPPTLEPEDVQAIVSRDFEYRLQLENEKLQGMLVQAQNALAKAQEQLKELDSLKVERAKLETRIEGLVEERSAERERLERQIQALSQKVEELSMKAGQEYAKGFQEGWSRHTQETRDEIN